MKRRIFLQSGSAAAVSLALTACGGGGASAEGAAAAPATSSLEASTTVLKSGTGYPFGSRLDAYVAGIAPTASTHEMDAAVIACYEAWKGANLVKADQVVEGGYAVRFGTSTTYRTVSEGIGYGMLVTVLMSGHDAQAQTYFDGMLKVVRARPAYGLGSKALCEWRIGMDGSSQGGGWNAMDGDLDIAMALLMADRQWGSKGAWNYMQEAVDTINDIKTFNMKEDGTTRGLGRPHVSRTSDYMITHFRAFAKATGDKYWSTTVIDRCYALIDRMQKKFAPKTGLMPDFIVNTGGEVTGQYAQTTGDDAVAVPSFAPGFGDFTDTEGFYYANASRNPWRMGSDYVTSGDARWKDVCGKLVDFIEADTNGNPAIISAGYHLDGAAMDRSYSPEGMIGPIMCGAMVDKRFQGFLDALWSWNSNNFTTDYYDSELQLIPMIVASGNWWNP